MNNSLRRLLVNTTGVIFVIVASVISYPAHAQVNPEIANCEEVQDEATLTQMEFCSGHIGCNMVLKLQKACTKVKGFLSKLKDTLSGRREITNNDVFEASSPTLTSSEALKTKVSAVQKIVRDASNDPNQGKFAIKSSGGSEGYYEGGHNNGKMHGVGVYINSNGGMGRGQAKNGYFEGQAQAFSNDGAMFVGDFVNSGPNGNIAFQNKDGMVLAGVYDGKKYSGLRETTTRSGNHWKDLLDAEGNLLASGPVAKAGQVAITPTAPGSTVTLPSQRDSSTPGSPDYQPSRSSAASGKVGGASSWAVQQQGATSSTAKQAPSSSGGAFCVAEHQQVLSLFQDGRDTSLMNDMNEWKKTVARNMGDRGNYSDIRCRRDPRDPPICSVWAKGVVPTPSSPNYDQALMLMVDVYTIKANGFLGPGPSDKKDNAQLMLLACVARHMANQIKGTKPSR